MRAVCESFHLAKDAGFKVVAHMMPDLPNVGMERDVEQFIVSNDIILLSFVIFQNSFSPCFLCLPFTRDTTFKPLSTTLNQLVEKVVIVD